MSTASIRHRSGYCFRIGIPRQITYHTGFLPPLSAARYDVCSMTRMRIAYVSFESPVSAGGVAKKMRAQVQQWMAQGHSVRHIVLGEQPQPGAPDYLRYPVRRAVVAQFMSASLYRYAIRKELSSFAPDVVYIRPTMWWPGLYTVLNGFRVVEEVNTDMGPEIDAAERHKVIKKALYRTGLVFEAKHIQASVYTTHELEQRLSRGQMSCVIGNGVDFPAVPRPVRAASAPPNLVMVSSSANQPWQGIDQLLRLATALPDYRFHLVGPFPDLKAPANMQLHGMMDHRRLAGLYDQMDFGIGVLALHNKKLSEACPLKVREYSAHGLPTIGGCRDTDLSGAPYYLDVGDMSSDFDAKLLSVRAFVSEWHGKPFPWEDARQRLNNAIKEQARTSFFEQVVKAR